jgi:hypothetical protein
MKTATAEDEGLPIVFLDIDDVLCLNKPYSGSDALEAVKGRHADPDTVLREIFAAEPKRVLASVHKEMGGQLRYVISSSWRQVFSRANRARLQDRQRRLRCCRPPREVGNAEQAAENGPNRGNPILVVKRNPNFLSYGNRKFPTPDYASASSERTRPAFNFSLSRYELPRMLSVTA